MMKKISIISWILSLTTFIISILGEYFVLNSKDVVHIIGTDTSSSTKAISKEIAIFFAFSNILQKIGFLFLVVGLISTGVYIYQNKR